MTSPITSPIKLPVIFTSPFTYNFLVGSSVPIPTYLLNLLQTDLFCYQFLNDFQDYDLKYKLYHHYFFEYTYNRIGGCKIFFCVAASESWPVPEICNLLSGLRCPNTNITLNTLIPPTQVLILLLHYLLNYPWHHLLHYQWHLCWLPVTSPVTLPVKLPMTSLFITSYITS